MNRNRPKILNSMRDIKTKASTKCVTKEIHLNVHLELYQRCTVFETKTKKEIRKKISTRIFFLVSAP